ncbi:hypothetical protein RUM43_010987 [Polyplax serrata]|uniref:tRNA-binding domain-containing protein n=1 Tax=Polyplax serrata TaxID=468196 RepID=A0AAN8PE56_POLSC
MASLEAMQKLESKAVQTENLIGLLKAEVSELQKAVNFCQDNLKTINVKKVEEIILENEKLKKEIEIQKAKLIEAEKKLDSEAVQSPTSPVIANSPVKAGSPKQETLKQAKSEDKVKKEKKKTPEEGEKKVGGKGAAQDAAKGDDAPVDIRRLDIRVGKIVNVKKHPDADSLYVEEVDLGEDKVRTVISGLVKYVPLEEMQNRMVVALCNLKPTKMRGIISEAMVLCASTPEKVEILTPPPGSCPGDRITVEGYPGEPDALLNPKKKIFETVAPDLKTNQDKVATYKGVPFLVTGKGVVTTQSLTNVQIK